MDYRKESYSLINNHNLCILKDTNYFEKELHKIIYNNLLSEDILLPDFGGHGIYDCELGSDMLRIVILNRRIIYQLIEIKYVKRINKKIILQVLKQKNSLIMLLKNKILQKCKNLKIKVEVRNALLINDDCIITDAEKISLFKIGTRIYYYEMPTIKIK